MNNVEVKTAHLDTFLKEEIIEITFNLDVKATYTFKRIRYNWMKEKIVVKYLMLYTTVESISQASSCLYIVKSGFSHVHYLLSRQKHFKQRTC